LHVPTIVYSTAAVRPPVWLPITPQLFRLCGPQHNRKNWLFCGSDKGGRTAATLASVIACCQRHAVDPFAYLRDVLGRIRTTPCDRLEDLLPDRRARASLESASCPTTA
jgi:hypothetical protein